MGYSEFTIIQDFFATQTLARNDVVLGIGDDAAITTLPAGCELVTAVDTLVSDVHFFPEANPEAIGHKALAVNLSDLAAMGAEPVWATLALTLPHADETWLTAFSNGFFALAQQYNVQLIGGDLSQGPLSVTVQVQGVIPQGKALRRDGAQAGDHIYVTGTLGEAALALIEKEQRFQHRLDFPEPRIAVGIALREIANSAIDISDGLLADLNHILDASQLGATLVVDQIPTPAPTALAVTHGDDYELCFTVSASQIPPLENALRALACTYTAIGQIDKQSGLRLQSADGSPFTIDMAGYEHFKNLP